MSWCFELILFDINWLEILTWESEPCGFDSQLRLTTIVKVNHDMWNDCIATNSFYHLIDCMVCLTFQCVECFLYPGYRDSLLGVNPITVSRILVQDKKNRFLETQLFFFCAIIPFLVSRRLAEKRPKESRSSVRPFVRPSCGCSKTIHHFFLKLCS